MEKPSRHLSQSQVSKLVNCGELYRLERIERKPSPPAAWTVKGVVVHDVLDWWEKDGRPQFDESEYKARWDTFYQKQLVRYPDLSQWTRTPRTGSTERDLELRYADGLKEILRYVARAESEAHLWVPFVIEGKPAVELPFELTLPGCDFTVQGYIDMLKFWKQTGVVTVSDYKTGSDKRQNWKQLGLYAYAARTIYGLDVNHGQYFYTKLDRPSKWKDLSDYTGEYLAEEYTKADKIIQQQLFVANPSLDGCTFCTVKQYCKESPE